MGKLTSNVPDNLGILKLLTSSLVEREDDSLAINKRLLNDNEFLRNILDTIPSYVFIKDRDSRFIYVNQRVAELYGLRREEIEGKLDSDIVFKEDLEALHKNDVDVIETRKEKTLLVESIFDRSGKRRCFVTTKKPLIEKDGSCNLLLGVSSEVTELEEAREALEESLVRFELAVSASEQGLWDWVDVRNNYEWWSPKYFEILGYENNEFVPSYDFWKNNLVHPEDFPALTERLKVCLDDPAQKWDVEYRMRRKDGEYRWFRTTGSILRSETGFPVRMIGFTEDVHDRREKYRMVETSERKLATILDSTLVGIILCDVTGKIILANREILNLSGYEKGELVGKNIEILIPEDLREAHRVSLENYVKGQGKGGVMGVLGRVVTICSKKGERVEVYLSVSFVEINDNQRFLATLNHKV